MAGKTHREVKAPAIHVRFLADYMAASEMKKRSIISGCKYRTIARTLQHREAMAAVGRFIRQGGGDPAILRDEAQRLRNRLTDDEFERQQADTNADFIDRYASIAAMVQLPAAQILPPGTTHYLTLSGVRVDPGIAFRLNRLTRTNNIRIGAAGIRYSKGKALPVDTAAWQSAFLLGYLQATSISDAASPEAKLCVTLDAYVGVVHPAPTDARRRFQNMQAACATIAERWSNIEAPKGAVL